MDTRDPLPPAGTVLVVDDDQSVLQSYALMLRLDGYAVVTTDSAADGLREVQDHRPGAILLDLRMPIVDGVEFLRRLRQWEAPHRTPVMILTGDYLVNEATVNDLRALGAEIRLKPLWTGDLVGIAHELLATQ